MSRHLVVALLACVAACLATRAHGFVRRGDVVVTQVGGLLRLDPATGVTLAIPVAPALRQPTGVVVLPDGHLVVADWAWPMGDAGSVVRVDVLAGTRQVLASGPPLVNPFSLARGPAGRVVLGDIDAGSHLPFPNAVLRRGTLFDLDPASGALVRRIEDCCEWNPVALVFSAADRVFAADAGCCAYGGPGQLAVGDLTTGQWAPLATSVAWRDPFGLALSRDGRTLFVAESAVAQHGAPALRAVDLASGVAATLVEGPPLGTPKGLLLEDDRRLLIADGLAPGVLRLDVTDGSVQAVATGDGFTEPASLAAVDVGDFVGGVPPASAVRGRCAGRAARDAERFVAGVLRCASRVDLAARAACVEQARHGWFVRAARQRDFFDCAYANRGRIGEALPAALLRTPGAALACAGSQAASMRLARAAARLYRERSRCGAAYLNGGREAARLAACQAAAEAAFLARTTRRCDEPSRRRIAAEAASLADVALGAWYCAP